MTCVVLGGGGFIGANLAAHLASRGHQVTAVDCAFPKFRRPALEGVDCWELDISHPARAQAAVAAGEWVFHLAADMGGVGYFHSDADLAASMANGRITLNVLEAVETDQRLFYASSACCYPTEIQMDVHTIPRLAEPLIGFGTPDALYGAEKLHGLRLCSKIPNARVGVFHTVYGPLQEHEGRRMKFPAAAATKALAARSSGRFELWGDGRQIRTYLHVGDAVERIVRIMEADDYCGPVNVGSHHPVSCREVAEMCLDIVGAEAEIVTNPAEPSGVLARSCDNTKFEADYGPALERSLRAGFTDFVNWLER